MKRAIPIVGLSMLLLVLLVAAPASAQKTDLTVGLAGLAQETLDPPVAGHFVKYYMSLM